MDIETLEDDWQPRPRCRSDLGIPSLKSVGKAMTLAAELAPATGEDTASKDANNGYSLA